MPQVRQIPALERHVDTLLRYNILDNKMLRGSQVMHLIKSVRGHSLTPEDEKVAQVGGLVVEFMRGWFNIEDDIMDQSKMRYGRPCWYQLEEVGISAVNDATMMSFIMLDMMRQHFRHLPCYDEVTNYMNQMNLITSFGQYIDETFTRVKYDPSTDRSYIDWSLYTMANYKKKIEYQTGHFDVMPIRLGLYLCDIEDALVHAKAQEIALKVGMLDSVSDDFMDVFFDPGTFGMDDGTTVDGNNCNDIQEGKMSWLVLTARERAGIEGRKIIEKHYGRKDVESVEKIKSIYLALGMDEIYAQFQSEICQEILDLIENWDEMATQVPRSIFPPVLSNIYVNGANLAL